MSAFVGLDVHSEKTFATVLDQDGRVVTQRRMINELSQVSLDSLMCGSSHLSNSRPHALLPNCTTLAGVRLYLSVEAGTSRKKRVPR